MRIDVHIHIEPGHEVLHRLDEIIRKLGLISAFEQRMENKMSLLDDKLAQNLAEVTAIKSRLDSLVAYQAGLRQQLADALAAANAQLTPEQAAVFDQVFAVHKATSDEIDESLNANVPPA